MIIGGSGTLGSSWFDCFEEIRIGRVIVRMIVVVVVGTGVLVQVYLNNNPVRYRRNEFFWRLFILNTR